MAEDGVFTALLRRILVILGVLLAIDVIADVGGVLDERITGWWEAHRARTQLQEIAAALNIEHVGAGQYPSDAEAFVIRKLGRSRARPLEDPWGHPITVRVFDEAYEIVSCGRDGECGTPDDVVVSGHPPRP